MTDTDALARGRAARNARLRAEAKEAVASYREFLHEEANLWDSIQRARKNGEPVRQMRDQWLRMWGQNVMPTDWQFQVADEKI